MGEWNQSPKEAGQGEERKRREGTVFRTDGFSLPGQVMVGYLRPGQHRAQKPAEAEVLTITTELQN